MGSRGEEGRQLSTSEEESVEQVVKKKRVRRRKKGRKKESGSEQDQAKEGSGQAENEAAPEKEENEMKDDKEEKKADEAEKERPERPKEASGVRRFSVSPRSRKGSNLHSKSPEKAKNPVEVEGRPNGPVGGASGAGGGGGRRMSKWEMFDQLRQHGIVDPNEDKVDLMDTIMAQAKASMSMLKVKDALKQAEDDDDEDEDIEDVEGSGLTSASTTRGGKGNNGPKTVPGVHVGETAAQLPVIPPQPQPQAQGAKEERGAGRGARGRRARGGKVVGRGRGRSDLTKPKKEEKKELAAAPNQSTSGNAEEERVSTIEFKLPQTTAEFERQLASMKHIPPAVVPPASRQRIPATLRLPPTNPIAALPPLVVHGGGAPPAKHQFSSSYDKWADKDFYADFKFQFIPMPQPRDALPCKFKLE